MTSTVHRKPSRFCLTAALVGALTGPGPALAQSEDAEPSQPLTPARTVRLDHGIVFTLPAGWEQDEIKDTRSGDKGRLSAYFRCLTPECAHSQETCYFVIRAAPVEGADDPERITNLYADPMQRYDRMRTTLIATSRDAQFIQPLDRKPIGQRDWYVVETDARHNMKSGLFAETVIDGWRLMVSCKTCETGEIRHQQARSMLESVRRE